MLKLQQVTKSFNQTVAVDNLSFEVNPGSIFGLLGPNGAGKTTTIRMIMNIIKPDSGSITFQDVPTEMQDYSLVGYLPEERGLYQKAKLLETITYFTRLKGLGTRVALEKARYYLRLFELDDYEGRKIEELSKGNQQKVQFIIAIVHEPTLVVLDEPFTGLDPVNQLLLKKIIEEQRQKGTTIIFSTHQMEQVEKLCDRILLIDHGRTLLYGELKKIKREYGVQHFQVEYSGDRAKLEELNLPGLTITNGKILGIVPEDADINGLLAAIMNRVTVTGFQLLEPSLEQIFIDQVQKGGGNA